MTDLQSYLDKALENIDIHKLEETDVVPDYDIDDEIRQLIVSTRSSLGITQKQLAEKTGLSQANISKIENGNYHPSIATLKRIADGLDKRLVIDFVDREVEE